MCNWSRFKQIGTLMAWNPDNFLDRGLRYSCAILPIQACPLGRVLARPVDQDQRELASGICIRPTIPLGLINIKESEGTSDSTSGFQSA
jgi:hypothetical protein